MSSAKETDNYRRVSQKISGSPQKKGKGEKGTENSEKLELKVKPEHRVTHEEVI